MRETGNEAMHLQQLQSGAASQPGPRRRRGRGRREGGGWPGAEGNRQGKSDPCTNTLKRQARGGTEDHQVEAQVCPGLGGFHDCDTGAATHAASSRMDPASESRIRVRSRLLWNLEGGSKTSLWSTHKNGCFHTGNAELFF